MSYGIVSYNNYSSNIRNISQDMLGGRVFVKYIAQGWVSGGVHDFPIPGVSNTAWLKIYTVSPGSHTVSTWLNGSTATVRLTAVSTSRPKDSYILVFATNTDEPEYGILSTSNNGERLVSTLYPCPQFLQKLTYNTSGTIIDAGNPGREVFEHQSVQNFTGNGQLKIILYTIPETTNDVWYSFDSFVGTGFNYKDTVYVERANGVAYNLPEGFVFALDNLTTSADTYGIRIYGPANPTSLLTFDSGQYYANIKGFETLDYSTTGTSVSSSVFAGNLPAFLIPGFKQEVVTAANGTYRWYNEYYGCVRRSGTTISSQKRLVSRYIEDGGALTNYTYGEFVNLCFAIDAEILGAAPTQPLAGSIGLTSGTTTCNYNIDVTSACSTSQVFTASYSGGNGNPVTYTWSLVGATGFSISGSTTSTSCTVVNNSALGTYTGTLQCLIQQSGSTSVTPTYSLSHTHTRDALSATLSVSSQQSTCSYSSGTCTTQETHSVSTSGGDGTTKTYAWTFVNNTGGFSFNTTNTATATVSVNAAAGTYTCRTRCTITQSGSSITVEQDVSHSHSQQSYTVSNPFAFNGTTAAHSNLIDGIASATLEIRRDGSWYTINGALATINNGTWVSPTNSTVGDNFWVRFTRNSTSGSTLGSASSSAGWIQITATRSVTVQMIQPSTTTSATRSANYTVDISATSAGSVLGTGTITLSATAKTEGGQ